MRNRFPKDRFDTIPRNLSRVGAHRIPRRSGGAWLWILWGAVAVVVLVALGVVGLFALNDRIDFVDVFRGTEAPAEPATPTPTVEPTIDPNAEIQVLNGTSTPGLAAEVAGRLTAAGWSSNISSANASTEDVSATRVYYQDPSQEAAARGIVQTLGAGQVELSDAFAIPTGEGEQPILRITVVLGADFPGAVAPGDGSGGEPQGESGEDQPAE